MGDAWEHAAARERAGQRGRRRPALGVRLRQPVRAVHADVELGLGGRAARRADDGQLRPVDGHLDERARHERREVVRAGRCDRQHARLGRRPQQRHELDGRHGDARRDRPAAASSATTATTASTASAASAASSTSSAAASTTAASASAASTSSATATTASTAAASASAATSASASVQAALRGPERGR